MTALFAYGTLMCEDVMRSVAGILPARQDGVAQGFRRLAVRGEEYPGLIAADGFEVRGVVYFDIPAGPWQRLDKFEGEMYERLAVSVTLDGGRPVEVWAYIVKKEFRERLEDRDWDFEAFLAKGKGAFVSHYSGYEALE